MTDKQIIIDGVDVSGCTYYADGKCTNSQMIQSNCKNVAVCYYKEYKRKEQECEELILENNELNELFDRLKVENETLFKAIEEVNKINKRLKAENEELEKWKKEHLKDVEFIERNPVIDILNLMADNILLEQRNEKLSKTLTEIKEIAEVLITTTDEYDSCYYKDRCSKCEIKEDCQYFKVEQILQKISEVENEHNG